MKHLNEEELILHYYGEAEAADAGRHLAGCEACREQYRALQLVLNTVTATPVPERDAGYEEAVWKRVAPELGVRSKRRWWRFSWQRLAAAGAMAGLLVAAYLAGRMSPHPQPRQFAAQSGQIRERVLMIAVGDHLDRSQMVLAELVNAQAVPGHKLDISSEQAYASDLVDDNRLYRQTAATTGDAALTAVLEDLERVLLDVANGNSQLSSKEVDAIRDRIESQGLLFKVRVVGDEIREREKQEPKTPAEHAL